MLRVFSWKYDYLCYPRSRGIAVLSGSTQYWYFTQHRLSTPLNELFRQFARVSLLRLPIAVLSVPEY